MPEHKPLMSNKEIERRRVWQEECYQKLKSIKTRQEVKVLGEEFIVFPGMFAPVFEDSAILADAVRNETKQGDYVLDIGTGTGIQAIFAAEKASRVIAVDINPVAIECARINTKNNGLDGKIHVLESNLFSNVKDKFDLIIYNSPFRWFKPRDLLEMGELDEDYSTLNRFFRTVKKFLNDKGRIIMIFSSSGDMKYFELLVKRSGLKFSIIRRKQIGEWLYKIYVLRV